MATAGRAVLVPVEQVPERACSAAHTPSRCRSPSRVAAPPRRTARARCRHSAREWQMGRSLAPGADVRWCPPPSGGAHGRNPAARHDAAARRLIGDDGGPVGRPAGIGLGLTGTAPKPPPV